MNWELIIGKIGTAIVDRRLWVSVFTAVAIILGSDALLGGVDGLSEQAVAYAEIIVKFATLIILALNQVNSWTKRPPSGLSYREIVE